MNADLSALQPYPFEKLRQLFEGIAPPADRPEIRLSVGEPQHPPPDFVLEIIRKNLDKLSLYPATGGLPELRAAIAAWLVQRYALPAVDPDTQVLPVNGTREALFAFAQAVVSREAGARSGGALVVSPNPFYQIYEGAALLAGATPRFVNCTAGALLPDFAAVTDDEWRRCQLLYLCSPGNPTGAVLPLEQLGELVDLAREHDFIIASDECYAEIYPQGGPPPPGLLQACARRGDGDFSNCVVFHSLSKRSNLPGLRSGFVAGDARVLRAFLLYRTYHGCAMPLHHQLASIAAWSDEEHVRANRAAYQAKFDAVLDIFAGHLDVERPEAGFYLWPTTPTADTAFARGLYARENVVVLPGRYLAREAGGVNPGVDRVRMALVAPLADCVEAARRTVRYLREA